MPANVLKLAVGVDPMRVYSAAANNWITKYYNAAANNDAEAAIHAFRMVIGLWKAIALLPNDYESITHEPIHRSVRTKGKDAYSPHNSQLSIRQ